MNCGLVRVDPASGKLVRRREAVCIGRLCLRCPAVVRTPSFEIKKAQKLVRVQRKISMNESFKYLSRRDKSTRHGRHMKAGPVETRARFIHNLIPLLVIAVGVLTPCVVTTLHMLNEESVSLFGSTNELLEDKPFGISDAERERARNSSRKTFPSLSVIMGRIEEDRMLTCVDNDNFNLVLECPRHSNNYTLLGGLRPTADPTDDCIYWDTTLKSWSTRGCELVSSSPVRTVCKCNYLTDFGTPMRSQSKFGNAYLRNRTLLHCLSFIGTRFCPSVLLALFIALAAYGHRYDAMLQRRSSMRGSLVALHVMGGMLARTLNINR